MKRLFLVVIAFVSFATFAFAGGDQNQNRHDGELGAGPTEQERISNPNIDATRAAQLDASQKETIYRIYEEEKVARDVYTALGEIYPEETTFANIQLSEQVHMDAVRNLCVTYGIPIPDMDQAHGEFELEEMAELYDAFVLEGKTSLASALDVGIRIEEMDIEDLSAALPGMPTDVQRVLNNLIAGSLNHLDAFTAALETLP